ncbi:MAG: PH domain-containing protein [Lachnospiraceae bacterium]|nr:PH domain-containing protein [Lachnospiraceae bacterium]
MEFRERKRILFFGLPWTFTVYTIGEEMLNIKRGFLKTVEDDCYMYKITDVKLETTLLEKMCGVATIICYAGDVTNPTIELVHVKNAKAIKDFILKTSEEQRLKRRTLNTYNLNSGDTDDIDDVDM